MSTSLADVYGLPKLLSLCAGATGAWVALCFGRARRVQRATGLERPLAAMAAALVASWALSGDRFVGLYGKYSLYAHGLLGFAACVALFVAVAWSSAPEEPAGIF